MDNVLPIGTKVKMNPRSEYRDQCLNSSGHLTTGVVIDYIFQFTDKCRHAAPKELQYYIETNYLYDIKWENGHVNSYRNQDVQPLETNNESFASFCLKQE